MKKRKIFSPAIIPISLLLLIAGTAAAQQGVTRLGINYTIASPVGAFKDFIGKTTGRAGDLSFLYGLNDKLSVGAELGFRDFYEKLPRQLYKLSDGSDISAVVSNVAQVIPLMAKATYNFLPAARIRPFVSAGAGVSFVSFNQYVGEYTNIAVNKISFIASPSGGISIPVGRQKTVAVNLTAFYTFLPFDDDYAKNLNHAGGKIGISFPLRD